MSTMRLIFTNSHTPLSPVIRAVTWSKYSHVAMISPCGTYVVESTLSRGGVKTDTLENVIKRSSAYEIVEFKVNNATAIWEAALTQVGKKYDWTALVGIPFHRDWSEDYAWFCSEFIAWAFDQGGTPLFNSENIHRITPGHIYMLHPTRLYSI